MTQTQILIKYLRWVREQDPEGGWVKEYSLRALNTPWGWVGSSGDRRARYLAQKGILERRRQGTYAEYRYKPQNYPILSNQDILRIATM